ncbi:exonuclease SbcC, partial [sediment metagenome]
MCGALEHPYVVHNPALDNALARLQDGLEHCRQALKELEIEEKTQLNQLENLGGRITQIELRRAQLNQNQESTLAAWSLAATRLSELFGAAETVEFLAWLAGQLARIQEESGRLAEQEARLRQATGNQQKAQGRLDGARKAHDALKDEVARLKAGAERTLAAIQSTHDHGAGARQRQEKALKQLDQAFPNANWRTEWASNPQQYHAACRNEAEQWSARKKTEETLLADLVSLEAAALGLSRQASETGNVHRQASQVLAEVGKQLQEQLAARRNVFAAMTLPAHPEGIRPPILGDTEVPHIESYLSSAVDAARRQQARTQHAFKEGEQQLAVRQERLAQLSKQLEANQIAAQQAMASLAQWLAVFNARSPEAPPLDGVSLNGLLAYDAAWIAAERQALGQLDTAIAGATGGLAQMRSQRASHENVRPTTDSPETVRANLEQA